MTTLENQIQAYAQQVREHPDNPSLLLAYAQVNLVSGRTLEALKVYQKISQEHPEWAEVRLAIARIYLMQKKYEESYAEVSRMLTQWPTYAGAHLLLKMLLKQADVPLEYIEPIRQVNGYLPTVDETQQLRRHLSDERQLIERSIEEFNTEDKQNPVVEYHIYCAQMRQAFLDTAVAVLDAWEKARLEQEQEERARQVAAELEARERERLRLEAERRLRLEEEERERLRLEEEERERLRLEEEERERIRLEEEERERLRREEEEQAAAEALRRPAPSEARAAFYQQHFSAIGEVIATLAKTRNVGAAMLVASDGHVVQMDLKETIDEEAVSSFVKDSLAFLNHHQTSGHFQLWVLEFEKGLLVTQSVHPAHVLVLLGSSGANFGALKFAMDKARPQLNGILAAAPP